MPTSVEERLARAFGKIDELFEGFSVSDLKVDSKQDGSSLTDMDLAINRILWEGLYDSNCDGWVSEETVKRYAAQRDGYVWIVDPIDGTKEFTMGLGEWAISVAGVMGDEFVLAAIYNPKTGMKVGWSKGHEVEVENMTRIQKPNERPRVLVSNTEFSKGLWAGFDETLFELVPCGSIAYKLGRVAGGEFEYTATIQPKNVWDIAGGIGLISAVGGLAQDLSGNTLDWGAIQDGISGMAACGPGYELSGLLGELAKLA